MNDAIAEQLNGSKNAEQTAQILKAAGVNFTNTQSKAPAEVLPEPVLGQLQKMQPGDIVQIREGNSMLMMQLKGSEAAPVDFAKAKPAIQARLKQNSMQSEGNLQMEDIKKKAKIEYLQKFDDVASAAKPAEAAASGQC